VTPADTWVVTPNNDTLYSRAFLDLTDEPIILSIPEVGGRSYWFPIGDMFHDLDALLSWDTVGPRGGDFAFCAPGFTRLLPDDVERIDVSTPFMWMVGRYTVQGEEDVPSVTALQDATRLTPLSSWDAAGHEVRRDLSRYPRFEFSGLTDAHAYFETFNELLRRNRPRARDEGLLDLFREIGLHPQQRFAWAALDVDVQDALTHAVETGHAIVTARTRSFARVVNGWVEAILDADLSQDPVNHAGVAMVGLLYSQKEASTYHVAYVDLAGETLDGSKGAYALTLDPPPPVEAFWSLTVYSSATRQYVANPIDRYAIGDRTPGLEFGAEGSLRILLAHEAPEAVANWLPVPAEPFYLVLREYTPKPAIITREWVPPAVQPITDA
jgi:hypothetical protein